MIRPIIHASFDQDTATWTYIVHQESSVNRHAAIIDSVLDFDIYSGRVTTRSADKLIEYIHTHDLIVEWILETHIHADHLSAAAYLKKQLGGKTAISKQIISVLNTWVPLLQTENDTPLDGSQFDHLFDDNEQFSIGDLKAQVFFTPGHTPADTSYLIENALFVGDTLLLPDVGTGRCDFFGGSADRAYDSCQKLLSLPEHLSVYVGHDYPHQSRVPICMTTIKDEKRDNIRCKNGVSREEFVKDRTTADAKKPVPKLLFPSLQVNLRAGALGAPDSERHFIKIPINAL